MLNIWLDTYNEKHDVFGWNLDKHVKTECLNPCARCKNFTKDFPHCKLPAIKSVTCNCDDGKFRYYEEE